MTFGPVSLASAVIHASGVTLLLIWPVVASVPLPEPREAVGVIDVLPPIVPVSSGRAPKKSAPTLARPSKAPVAPRPAVVVPSVSDVAPPRADAIDDPQCLGCTLGPTGDGPGLAGSTFGRDLGIDKENAVAPPATVRIGSGIQPPKKLVHVDPLYPELARRASVQGVVLLECTIDPRGSIADVVVRRGHPLLIEAAVEAVKQWRYAPTRLNGVPVAVLMTVTVRFTQPR